MPLPFARWGWHPSRSQKPGNAAGRLPVQETPVDSANNLRFFRDNLRGAILAFSVAKELAIRHGKLALRKPLSDAPGRVLTDAPAFLLREAAHDGDQQFPLERLIDTLTRCTQNAPRRLDLGASFDCMYSSCIKAPPLKKRRCKLTYESLLRMFSIFSVLPPPISSGSRNSPLSTSRRNASTTSGAN